MNFISADETRLNLHLNLFHYWKISTIFVLMFFFVLLTAIYLLSMFALITNITS